MIHSKRALRIFIIIGVVIAGLSVIYPACAVIPEDVKDHYEYNQKDRSIIKVKKRLQELGYFHKKATFSGVVSEELKKAVIDFQNHNGLAADGEINRELLELLFSEDAVEKGGKPRQSVPAVTEPPEPKPTVKEDSPGGNRQGSKESPNNKEVSHNKEGSHNSIFIAAGVIAAAVFLLLVIASEIRKKKLRSLMHVFDEYRRIKSDSRCKKAITESGLTMDLLASGGEYFMIPLIWDGTKYSLHYDTNDILKAEKKYCTAIVSKLDRICRNGLNREEVHQDLCNIWGFRKDDKPVGTIGLEEFRKTMELFSSLVSSGAIRSGRKESRDAFLFLLWECALDEIGKYKKLAEKNISEAKQKRPDGTETAFSGPETPSKSKTGSAAAEKYRETVYLLYEVMEMDAEEIILLITAKEYMDYGNTLWRSLYAQNSKYTETIVGEIEKIRKKQSAVSAD